MSKKYESILIHIDPSHQPTDGYQQFVANLKRLNSGATETEWNPASDLLEPIEALMDVAQIADDIGVAELFHVEHLQPDSLQHILTGLRVTAAQTILFSDSPNSTAIAKDLGIQTIGIATRYDTEQFEKADFVMKHFGDEILRQLF